MKNNNSHIKKTSNTYQHVIKQYYAIELNYIWLANLKLIVSESLTSYAHVAANSKFETLL